MNMTHPQTAKKPRTVDKILSCANSFPLCHCRGIAFLIYGNQALEIGSQQYRDFISRVYYRETGNVPSDKNMKDVSAIQRGAAFFDSPERDVFVRIGSSESIVFLDICDANNTIIEIDNKGVRKAKKPSVLFFRPPHLKPLPAPELPGNIEMIKPVFGLSNDDDFILIRSILCFWLRGRPGQRGTYPVLNFTGPAGSGKTTRAKICKYIIDPATPEARTPGKDPRELFIAAKNQFCLTFDNVSYLDPDMQDALCSLASQGGYGRKKNYTDDEEQIFEECRPICTNGISFKARPDLQSRMINIELSQIGSQERKTEKQIWSEIEKHRPEIIGGLLTALSKGLRAEQQNKIDVSQHDLPRLADFGEFALYLEAGNGWDVGGTIEALKDNYSGALAHIADESPIPAALKSFIDFNGSFSGTATQLLEELESRADDRIKKFKDWPTSPAKLSNAIDRNIDVLANIGLDIEKGNRDKAGNRIIEIKQKPPGGGVTDSIPF